MFEQFRRIYVLSFLADGGLWRLPHTPFQHSLQLHSVYAAAATGAAGAAGSVDASQLQGEPRATNITKTFAGTLDYIFCSRDGLRVVDVVCSCTRFVFGTGTSHFYVCNTECVHDFTATINLCRRGSIYWRRIAIATVAV
jgi:hypothetical protein